MKVVLLNFSGPVEKRLVQWLRENNMETTTLQTEEGKDLMVRMSDIAPDIILLNTVQTPRLVSTIQQFCDRFKSLIMIGLTDNYSRFIREKLIMAGLNEYMDINELVEKGPDHLRSFLLERDS
ncbi:MAG: hypothetical protein GXO83_11605 [Chlorobi bacterium]|nr:hypothetical protein [Chlorobiota bacterium]